MIREWQIQDVLALIHISEGVYDDAPRFYHIPDNYEHALSCIKLYQNADKMRFYYRAIVVDEEIVGFLRAEKIKEDVCEIGYYIEKNHRGRGIMSEALTAFLKVMDQVCWVHYVYARVDHQNIGSKQVLLKNHFISVGSIDDIDFYVWGKDGLKYPNNE